jgi:hypothetical protein
MGKQSQLAKATTKKVEALLHENATITDGARSGVRGPVTGPKKTRPLQGGESAYIVPLELEAQIGALKQAILAKSIEVEPDPQERANLGYRLTLDRLRALNRTRGVSR